MAFGTSRLLAPRANRNGNLEGQTGGRIQLPPATNNKLPVVYGSAFINPTITDVKISTDNQYMWYVLPLCEVTSTGTISFGDIYYNGSKVTLSGTNVSSLTNNAGEVDSKISGNLDLFLFNNGSSSGVNTGQTAIQIMSDTRIPSNQRWSSSLYTSNGQSPTMSNTCFLIARIKYNQDASTTQLGTFNVQLTNTLTKPGTCILDYMQNVRYGCAIPLAEIDTTSLTDLDTYSDQLITFTNTSGGSSTQPKYRVNGPVDTNKSCLENLQDLVDTCDSWLQYDEIAGKWKVVPNKGYAEAPNALTTNDLFLVDASNLVSGIDITPSNLSGTFNQVEFQHPSSVIRDQFDFTFYDLADELPELLNQNEPINKLNIRSELVNNRVQASYLAIRRLLQSREDLIIDFTCDHSAIVVSAGDVIRVTHEQYGWSSKLFRVSNVVEQEDETGSLTAKISAFEYNDSIYDNNIDIVDFIPSMNTGLTDPNIFSGVAVPVVTVDNTGTIKKINVQVTVPASGLVRYLDINYGENSDSSTHVLYRRISNSDGTPLVNSTVYDIDVTDLPVNGNVYFSVNARNTVSGTRSTSSSVVTFTGAGITEYNPSTGLGGIRTENIAPATITSEMLDFPIDDIQVVDTLPTCNVSTQGKIVYLTTDNKLYSCDGTSFAPVVSTSNLVGQIVTNQIANAAITNQLIAANAVTANNIVANTITTNQIAVGTITGDRIAAATIAGDRIQAGTISAGLIAANAITASRITVANRDDIFPDRGFRDLIWHNLVGAGTAQDGSGTSQPIRFYRLNSGANTRDSLSQTIDVEPGAAYRVRLRMFIPSTATGFFAPSIEFPNQAWVNPAPTTDGAPFGFTDYPVINLSTTSIPKDVWVSYDVVRTFAVNTQGNFLRIRYNWGITAGTGIDFAIEVTRAASSDLIVDGAVTADKLNVNSLSAITANVGDLTAGTIRNTNNTYITNLNDGRTVVRTGPSGAFMKVSGAPFGSSSQFIEWYGPYFASLTSCTEANANYYLKTDGSAYFGGSLSAGILKNSAATSAIANNASITVGPFGTNGNPIIVVTGYIIESNEIQTYPATTQGVTAWNAAVTAWGATPGVEVDATKSITCNVVVQLNRTIAPGSPSLWQTLTITSGTETLVGVRPVPGDTTGDLTYTRTVFGSLTSTDNTGGTGNRTLTATITTRTGANLTNIVSQRVSIVATEE